MNKSLMSCIAVSLICISSGSVEANDPKPFDYKLYGGEENCLKSDFDGNGVSDYVAPLGEGWIRVFMNYGAKSEKAIDIDAGGVAELYAPRSAVGRNGEPIVERPSILVRWVGQDHVVFTWDGAGFKRVTFPGFYKRP